MSFLTFIQMRNFMRVPLPASERVCFHANFCPFQVVSLVPHSPTPQYHQDRLPGNGGLMLFISLLAAKAEQQLLQG